MNAEEIRQLLAQHKDPERAITSARFFKTGVGEYGEGDLFWGLRVPEIRLLTRPYAKQVSLNEISRLLDDPVHECRMAGILLLVRKYQKGSEEIKEEIVEFYLRHIPKLNNWDFVDISCEAILGDYLLSRDRSILYRLAESENLWEQRVAIVSTLAFVRQGETQDVFALAEKLLEHPHDLIRKAVGWLLREAGKRESHTLRAFLKRYYSKISRTSLRYAIERFPEEERKRILEESK